MKRLPFLLLCAFSAVVARSGEPDPLATLRPGHPRLLVSDEQLAAAVDAAKTDPLRARVHARIIALAEAELASTPIRHVLAGPRLLTQSRMCVARVLTCAMAYRLSGDIRFAERAKKEMFTAAGFPDWNPSHFLDVAEMAFAVAVGYDWLQAQLTADERERIKSALLKHALSFAPAAYAASGATDRRLWFVKAHHNWNQVCNGGLLAAALALADEEPAIARTVVDGARKSLPLAMAEYEPDGAYPEGPGYWSYGTSYNVIALALLESALGHDFGLGRAPAFDRTALYRLHVQSPTGLSFNYADGSPSMGAGPEYTWLTTRYHHPAALQHSRSLLESELARRRRSATDGDRLFALHSIWFPSPGDRPSPSILATAPLDARFRGPAEIAMFRSAWNNPGALFIGFKAGRNDVNHSHLDLGSFVLDADGVRWAQDLGPDDYNLPAYFGARRWTYYRLNNHSHNTLTPGDTLQDPKARAPIIAFASTPARAFAVSELTRAYPGTADTLLRGIALLDRARVLIQDDISGLKSGTPLSCRLLTGAAVKIEESRRAILTAQGRTLRVEILSPSNARFTTKPAAPATSTEKQNTGITVLTAEVAPGAADVRVAVLLTPVGDSWPRALPIPTLTPLAEWK